MKSTILICLLLLIEFTVQGQTIIPGGYVSGIWESSQSPYHIQGNIEIHYDSTLIIEPGVDLLFDSSYLFTINGRIDATGTLADSVRFTASIDSIGWKGIYFNQINVVLDSSFLKYCSVTRVKKTNEEGGALYIVQSDKIRIDHCLISNNSCEYEAGGIQIEEGDIFLTNSIIRDNTAYSGSGGIRCILSSPVFSDLTISNNSSAIVGGLYYYSNPDSALIHFKRLNIFNNKGGGIGGLALQFAPNVMLDQCNICYNEGDNCGGIGFYDNSYFSDSIPDGKNSIYFNKGGIANELYIYEYQYQPINIFVDTFSVPIPDNYHVFPNNSFNFIDGIQYGFINPLDTNLFISVLGSDENDGLSVEHPLRSFDYALRLIKEDPSNPNTLWVLPGIYHLTESESGSSIYLKDNTNIKAIQNNQVSVDGDATSRIITGVDVHNLQISGITIINGYTAIDGGGACLTNSFGKIDSCTFDSNVALDYGGGIYTKSTSLSLNSCIFINNHSGWGGGAYIGYFGTGTIRFNNCDFIENHSSGWGGGLHSDGANMSLLNCRFISNQSSHFGGGASFWGYYNPLLVGCGFYKNEALNGAGGLLLDETSTNGYFINCTFSDNISPEGSAMIIAESGMVQMTNSIIWNEDISSEDLIHIYDFEEEDSTILNIDHTDLQGGENSLIVEPGKIALNWLENNMNFMPEFTDPENSDYSLNWNSPCIEAGKGDTSGLHLPLTDLNGDPRIVNPRIDMGAYEYQFPVNINLPHPLDSSFRIYPIIASNRIKIEFPQTYWEDQLILKICSSTGSEVKSFGKIIGSSETEVDVSELSPGLYFIVILDSYNFLNTFKIVIAR